MAAHLPQQKILLNKTNCCSPDPSRKSTGALGQNVKKEDVHAPTKQGNGVEVSGHGQANMNESLYSPSVVGV